MNTLIG